MQAKVSKLWLRRFRLFFCCITKDEYGDEAILQSAEIFSSLFTGTDLVPSGKCQKKRNSSLLVKSLFFQTWLPDQFWCVFVKRKKIENYVAFKCWMTCRVHVIQLICLVSLIHNVHRGWHSKMLNISYDSRYQAMVGLWCV
jgi:hypothetical protein